MELTRTIEIPNFREDREYFEYYILTKGKINDYSEDFIRVPGLRDTVTKVVIMPCWANSLITYKSDGEFFTIPAHNHLTYGIPIFTNEKDSYDNEDECTLHLDWKCPQNFFLTHSSAEQMLWFLKKKYGFITNSVFSLGNYSFIDPFGHFNKRSY